MRPLMLAALVAATALPLAAQSRAADSLAVIAVADSALAAITRNEFNALGDLMIPEGTVIGTAMRGGAPTVRTRAIAVERTQRSNGTITERGFGGTAMVAGNVATVWMPYDLYINGAWSHCGVDAFVLVRTTAGWRIVTLTYSIEQPPACSRHPNGPPA